MVVKVNISRSVHRALSYNEQKLSTGKAKCLYAHHYLPLAEEMSYEQKRYGLEHRSVLNDRAATNTLHLSLNFDPMDCLSKEKLVTIASTYMEKMGFSGQPYLVYQHLDAAHPHLHIIASLIREDGSRIHTHNIGKRESEKARKEIEQTFQLIKAEEKKAALYQKAKPLDASIPLYGKVETKKGISSVLRAVVGAYKYTSLEEFNAVLRQFNVVADRGKENSRIYQHNGLVYRMLDEAGRKRGVPIKASSLEGKPTLGKLEQRFTWNARRKVPYLEKVKWSIEAAVSAQPSTMQEFMQKLKEKNIYTLLKQDRKEQGGGLTFVDNETKCVFRGSDLGKNYTVSAIQSRLTADKSFSRENTPSPSLAGSLKLPQELKSNIANQQQEQQGKGDLKKDGLVDILLSSTKEESLSPGLLQKKRKRKKQNLHF